MNGKQKLLSFFMAGAFGLRWLAGSELSDGEGWVTSALTSFDKALGWTLAIAFILGIGWGFGHLRNRYFSNESKHDGCS